MQSRKVYLARLHEYLDHNQLQKNPHCEAHLIVFVPIWGCSM
jgi:hypothetical protein